MTRTQMHDSKAFKKKKSSEEAPNDQMLHSNKKNRGFI